MMAIKGKILGAISELVRRGVSPNEIYRQTGYKRGIDGTWLDMSKDVRMQRAREQGFGDQTFYHGTDADIQSFDRSKFGASTEASSAKQGVWLTSDPSTARSYAEYSATNVPVKNKLKEADRAEARGDWDAYDQAIVDAENLEAEIYKEPNRGQNILPITFRGKIKEVDAGGAEFMEIQDKINRDITAAKREGFDGVKFKNLSDDVGFSDRPSDHVVVFDPKNIRSPNALFDPAAKDSPNLLASSAPVAVSSGLLGLGAMSPQQAEAAGIRPPSLGTIEAARAPWLAQAANYLEMVDTPIGKPFEGIAAWARGAAYQDPDKLKRAAVGALDIMP